MVFSDDVLGATEFVAHGGGGCLVGCPLAFAISAAAIFRKFLCDFRKFLCDFGPVRDFGRPVRKLKITSQNRTQTCSKSLAERALLKSGCAPAQFPGSVESLNLK